MALMNFLKPKNKLEEGGRTSAPFRETQASRKRAVLIAARIFPSAAFGQMTLFAPAAITLE